MRGMMALRIVVRFLNTVSNSCNLGPRIRFYLVETTAQVSREAGSDSQESPRKGLRRQTGLPSLEDRQNSVTVPLGFLGTSFHQQAHL